MIVTRLDTRQAIAACLDQWRRSVIDCDDAELPEHVRDIESVSRMVYSVMLDTVAELESRNIAVTAGFRNTKQRSRTQKIRSSDQQARDSAHSLVMDSGQRHRRGGTSRGGRRPGVGGGVPGWVGAGWLRWW